MNGPADRKAPVIDPYVDDAERETSPPAGVPSDPAKVVQQIVGPEDDAVELDPTTHPEDPRAGYQR
jgi:hypothetical protein